MENRELESCFIMENSSTIIYNNPLYEKHLYSPVCAKCSKEGQREGT